jgi:PAS domain S-box-containing protein
MSDYLYIAFLVISVISSGIVSFLSYRKKPKRCHLSLSVLSLLLFLWSLFQLLYLLPFSLNIKIALLYLRQSVIVLTTLIWLFFAIEYSKKDSFFIKKNVLPLIIPAFIFCIIIFTNNYHKLYFSGLVLIKDTWLSYTSIDYKLFFWFHTLYGYTFILLGIIIILNTVFSAHISYTRRSIIIIIAVFFPWLINIIIVFKLFNLAEYIDLTPVSFTLTVILLYTGIFRLKLLDILPIARKMVIENVPDLILVLDKKKRVIDFNISAGKVFSQDKEQIAGKHISKLIPKFSVIKKKVSNDEIKKDFKEKVMIKKNGINYYYHLQLSPIHMKGNIIRGYILVLRDITSIENKMVELTIEKNIADKKTQTKTEFIEKMLADIRLPLNSIVLANELISLSEHTPEQSEYLNIIQKSTEELIQMTSDMLDYNLLSTKSITPEYESFNFKTEINKTINSIKKIAEDKDLRINFNIDSCINYRVNGDRLRLKQVLLNLIKYSVKNTPKGELSIIVKEDSKTKNYTTFKFIIKDNGLGITKEKINELLYGLQKNDTTLFRKYSFSDISITLSQKILKKLDSTLEISSTIGSGTTFSFLLTYKKHTDKNVIAEKKPQSRLVESIEKGYHILLCESETNELDLLANMLNKSGFKVDIASTVEEMCRKCNKYFYDIIFSEIIINNAVVFDCIEKIRQSEKNKERHIPIIAIVAGSLNKNILNCKNAGMDDIIQKPLKMRNIALILEKYIT